MAPLHPASLSRPQIPSSRSSAPFPILHSSLVMHHSSFDITSELIYSAPAAAGQALTSASSWSLPTLVLTLS